MKKVMIFALLSLLSFSSFAFDAAEARAVIFEAVKKEHLCDQAQYYTESVCSGAFLSEVLPSENFDAYEVTFEFEPGFFLHAIAFADGEVTVSYWSN